MGIARVSSILTLSEFRSYLVVLAIVSEWLKRRTRNPLGFTRVGSNPTDCGMFVDITALVV